MHQSSWINIKLFFFSFIFPYNYLLHSFFSTGCLIERFLELHPKHPSPSREPYFISLSVLGTGTHSSALKSVFANSSEKLSNKVVNDQNHFCNVCFLGVLCNAVRKCYHSHQTLLFCNDSQIIQVIKTGSVNVHSLGKLFFLQILYHLLKLSIYIKQQENDLSQSVGFQQLSFGLKRGVASLLISGNKFHFVKFTSHICKYLYSMKVNVPCDLEHLRFFFFSFVKMLYPVIIL